MAPKRKAKQVADEVTSNEVPEEGEIFEASEPTTTTEDTDGQEGEFISAQLSSRDQRRKSKKQLKRQKILESKPEFELSKEVSSIKIKDVRDLILWILGDGIALNWALIKHKQNVHHVVVTIVNGLHKAFVEQFKDSFQHLTSSAYSSGVLTNAPGAKGRIHSSVQTLIQVPLSKSQKQRRDERKKKEQSEAKATFKIQPAELLLPAEVMKANNYFMEEDRDSNADLKDFISVTSKAHAKSDDTESPRQTKKRRQSQSSSTTEPQPEQLLAIDCEMCRTENGLELTRVSIVNTNLEVLYDTYVKPTMDILDYNTRWSGITEETLKDVTTTLADVHEKLQEIITPNSILVGHSLENDLRALKLFHNRVIDTALTYEHPRGPPSKPGLKWLAEQYLNRKIQESEKGHDSTEDACAAMQLVLLKLEKGFEFGETEQDVEPIFTRLARLNHSSAVVDTASFVRANAGPPAIGAPVENDDQVVTEMAKLLPERHFILGRLVQLETYLKKCETEKTQLSEASLREISASIDAKLQRIHSSLPANTLFIVLSGHGDMTEARRLMALQAENKSAWTEANQAALEEAVASGRACVSFFSIV